ncbi:MAG: hypothetical protein Q9P90_01315 [candidate division KSB1 bacterium]|nr:hypothetical protein [candidate division KSB1 bacterium]
MSRQMIRKPRVAMGIQWRRLTDRMQTVLVAALMMGTLACAGSSQKLMVPEEDPAPLEWYDYDATPDDRHHFAIVTEPVQASKITSMPVPSDSIRVSFQFEDVVLWQAVRTVAHAFQKNFVASDSLNARVNQSLYNADLQEALTSLLQPAGYVFWLENGVIHIRRADENLTRIYTLQHGRAENIWPAFKKILARVSGFADSLRNVIILSGPAAEVLQTEAMLARLDEQRPDILIQAEIIELSDGLTRNLGVQWQGTASSGNFSVIGESSQFQQQLTSILQLGYLNSNQLTTLLEAVDESRDARLLSRPRIVATSGELASILAGERVPYTRVSEETASGGFLQQVEFVDVGIKLTIVAHAIDGGRRVVLEVHPEVSEVLDKAVQGVPRIATREAHTKITVDDGMTAVIGGLTREHKAIVETGVPVLRSIPGIGWLFKRRSVETTRTELLVLITPKILTPERREELLLERKKF